MRARDAVVVGAGMAGAATALALQRRGLTVTLLDAWAPGHLRATSAGHHRVIRSSHGNDELYTLWSREARLRWLELEQETGTRIFYESGAMIMAADGDTAWENASHETMTRLGIPNFKIHRSELAVRLPVVDLTRVEFGLWEPESGFLMARDGLLATIDMFRKAGGVVECRRVATDGDERPMIDGKPIEADIIVMAAGPWMGDLFPRTLRHLLDVVRQDVVIVSTPAGSNAYDWTQMPAWIDHGYPAYGIPAVDGHGFKAAIAWHETVIDLDHDDRVVDAAAIARFRRYIATRFPGLSDQPITDQKVCQITNTADLHFIVDRHPEHESVFFCAGGSGHLYKHGPVLGDFTAGYAVGAYATDERFRLTNRSRKMKADAAR